MILWYSCAGSLPGGRAGLKRAAPGGPDPKNPRVRALRRPTGARPGILAPSPPDTIRLEGYGNEFARPLVLPERPDDLPPAGRSSPPTGLPSTGEVQTAG